MKPCEQDLENLSGEQNSNTQTTLKEMQAMWIILNITVIVCEWEMLCKKVDHLFQYMEELLC